MRPVQKYPTLMLSLVILVFYSFNIHARIYVKNNFRYYYSGKDEKLIDRLDEKLRLKLEYAENALQGNLSGNIKIYLTLTLEDFNKLTRGRAPKWAGGLAYPKRKAVVLKMPMFFGQGTPLEVLATHELTHLLIHQITGDNYLPGWLNEGICQVLAGETRSGSLARLGRAAATDRLMGLPRVDDVLRFSQPDADLAYAEARSAAEWLVRKYDWDSVVRLLKLVSTGIEFEPAFKEVFEVDYEYWQVEWIEYAKDRYSYAVLLDIDSWIWIFILLLGIAAITATFIRRRMQFKKWMEEEDDEDDYFKPINPS